MGIFENVLRMWFWHPACLTVVSRNAATLRCLKEETGCLFDDMEKGRFHREVRSPGEDESREQRATTVQEVREAASNSRKLTAVH